MVTAVLNSITAGSSFKPAKDDILDDVAKKVGEVAEDFFETLKAVVNTVVETFSSLEKLGDSFYVFLGGSSVVVGGAVAGAMFGVLGGVPGMIIGAAVGVVVAVVVAKVCLVWGQKHP